MTALGGLFLIAHGLVHLAVWLPEPKEDAPFDPRHSWLFGHPRGTPQALAALACAVLVVGGLLVMVGAGAGAALAVAGAAVSLMLIVLTFNVWLLAAVAIDVAIAVVTLA